MSPHDASDADERASTARDVSALLLGATGAVGKHVLRELIASGEFTRVGEYGRRVTPIEHLGPNAQGKLEQKTVDFEKIEDAGLRDGKWDVVFITLGTTRAAAGSANAFEKIDREYTINSARAAKTDDPSHEQRLVYVSSMGANTNSPFLYSKSKGLTENGLADLKYSDTIVFRPGFLANAQRPSTRLTESLAGSIIGFASNVISGLQIDVSTLGKAIVRSGFLGSEKLPSVAEATKAKTPGGAQFTIIGNRGAEKFANAPL
ncbi:uncharacterized protein FOMMEDRAFT_170061 [Fomitiporia mediterranea MF3/22]|uniref:uncharacterized protein n=1 Tax=Fomitiporia mediterranea (strain MF3/22) TaxID=694068 RepID=UPI00044092A9|nr:uncharacterized protein FOMMEDRAFT_170061 [Fomitiporia mediterranea MF3/22]EJC99970.1 hypothetical protein FOMMEDRAFT_170061 [Fomitiporia mediterranea MF3/22]